MDGGRVVHPRPLIISPINFFRVFSTNSNFIRGALDILQLLGKLLVLFFDILTLFGDSFNKLKGSCEMIITAIPGYHITFLQNSLILSSFLRVLCEILFCLTLRFSLLTFYFRLNILVRMVSVHPPILKNFFYICPRFCLISYPA